MNLREDLTELDYAIANGFAVNRGSDEALLFGGKLPVYLVEEAGRMVERVQCTGDSYKFSKLNKRIWSNGIKWICAELINGHYGNHRYYGHLKQALDKEK